MGKYLVLAAALWGAAPALAQDVEMDLGIPTETLWENVSEEQEESKEEKIERPMHPLEIKFWDRIEDDLVLLERWRAGLLGVLRHAKTRPQVFPIKQGSSGLQFSEYRREARESWRRAMDYWLALETLLDRYGEFDQLAGAREKRLAFFATYGVFLAQARFAREWARVCVHEPELEKIFNAPEPRLGLPANSYNTMQNRYRGEEFRSVLKALRSYYYHGRKSKVLKDVLGARRQEWVRARQDDLKHLREPEHIRIRSVVESLRILRRSNYRADFPIRSEAQEWTAEEADIQARKKEPFFPPQPDWARATISTRAAYAVDTLRHWFRMDPSTQARPSVLISLDQMEELERNLQPGDILLVRREHFIEEIGLDGYWHHAGLYIGTADQRKSIFKSTGQHEEIEEAYVKASGFVEPPPRKRNWRKRAGQWMRTLKPWGVSGSTVAAFKKEKPAPPPEPPVVLQAGSDGVSLEKLSRFAAADVLAVVRPKVADNEKGRALLKGMALIGKPYDFLYDFRSDTAVSSAELIYRSYSQRKGGLRLSLRDIGGVWSLSSNGIARKFDSEFGTNREELEWVLFWDAHEKYKETVSSVLEEFRRSWRRPKWVFN